LREGLFCVKARQSASKRVYIDIMAKPNITLFENTLKEEKAFYRENKTLPLP
jgi:hypothetical protein